MAYKLMKRIIARDVKNGTLNRAATMDKLDAFLAADGDGVSGTRGDDAR